MSQERQAMSVGVTGAELATPAVTGRRDFSTLCRPADCPNPKQVAFGLRHNFEPPGVAHYSDPGSPCKGKKNAEKGMPSRLGRVGWPTPWPINVGRCLLWPSSYFAN